MCYTGKCQYERMFTANGDPDGECRFTNKFPPDAFCQQHTREEFDFEEPRILIELREKVRNFVFFDDRINTRSIEPMYRNLAIEQQPIKAIKCRHFMI